MHTLRNTVGLILFGLLGTAAVALVFDYALALPDVYVSYSTQECVSVTTYQGVFFDSLKYNCENMPPKYNHVWVK